MKGKDIKVKCRMTSEWMFGMCLVMILLGAGFAGGASTALCLEDDDRPLDDRYVLRDSYYGSGVDGKFCVGERTIDISGKGSRLDAILREVHETDDDIWRLDIDCAIL